MGVQASQSPDASGKSKFGKQCISGIELSGIDLSGSLADLSLNIAVGDYINIKCTDGSGGG